MTRLLLILLTILLTILQMTVNSQNIDQLVESIVESQTGEDKQGKDPSIVLEELLYRLEHPININAAGPEELSDLFLLNELQTHNILQYREEHGPILSIYELKGVDGISEELLHQLQPFLTFEPQALTPPTLKEEVKKARQELLLRSQTTLQKAKGYVRNEEGVSPYEGNRFRSYARYRFRAGSQLSAGITAEKDPGEAFFGQSNPQGFDFYSAHLSLHTNKLIRQIIVGDYLIRSGQGLVLWQGYANSKSENVLGIEKTGQGVRPYTSTDENFFFRGTCITWQLDKLQLHAFASWNAADASLKTDSAGFYFSTLSSSGYHRTPSEIANENAIHTQNYGSVGSIRFKNLRISTTAIFQQFDTRFKHSKNYYDIYNIDSKKQFNIGIDYLFSKNKYIIFGETAQSKSGGRAFIQGASISPDDQLQLSLLLRHYDTDYRALWAKGFGEGSNTRNESGLYIGMQFLPAPRISLCTYIDFSKTSFPSYSSAAPSRNHDFFLQANLQINPRHELYLRLKSEQKEQKTKLEHRYVNIRETQNHFRLHSNLTPNKSLLLRTRLEASLIKGENHEKGIMIYQDLKYTGSQQKTALSARVAWFNTDSYSSAIYAYENDLLYVFSVPAYFGKGLRNYLNIKQQISPNCELWFKFSNSHYFHQQSISSGYNKIEGVNKTELKIQVRLKF